MQKGKIGKNIMFTLAIQFICIVVLFVIFSKNGLAGEIKSALNFFFRNIACFFDEVFLKLSSLYFSHFATFLICLIVLSFFVVSIFILFRIFICKKDKKLELKFSEQQDKKEQSRKSFEKIYLIYSKFLC